MTLMFSEYVMSELDISIFDTSCLMDDSIKTDSEYGFDKFDFDCDLN